MMCAPIRRRDAQAALIRALLPRLGPAELIEARSTPWSSATFDGARHELRVRLAGSDRQAREARLIDELPEAEFELRDHFVADLTVAPGPDCETRIEALTIEAR